MSSALETLGEKIATARKAREIIIAPNLPPMPKQHTGNPFTSDGWIVADCTAVDPMTGKICGWHALGPRSDMKLAINEHHRLYHSQEIVATLLNHPR